MSITLYKIAILYMRRKIYVLHVGVSYKVGKDNAENSKVAQVDCKSGLFRHIIEGGMTHITSNAECYL